MNAFREILSFKELEMRDSAGLVLFCAGGLLLDWLFQRRHPPKYSQKIKPWIFP